MGLSVPPPESPKGTLSEANRQANAWLDARPKDQ